MKRLWLPLTLIPGAAAAQWGNVAKKEEPKGFSWTDPLWPDFWMAWTPATLAIFVRRPVVHHALGHSVHLPRMAWARRPAALDPSWDCHCVGHILLLESLMRHKNPNGSAPVRAEGVWHA